MEQRFVVRMNGVNERRGFPLRLRNALRRLFVRAVERTALRDAAPFLAAVNPNRQPTPPTDRVSFLTTSRFNHLAVYVPTTAPVSQQIAISQLFVQWYATALQNGYSATATDARWKIHLLETTTENETVLVGFFGSSQLFRYTVGLVVVPT